MLLGTLGVSSLTGKGMYKSVFGNNKCNCDQEIYIAESREKRLYRAGQEIKKITNATTSFDKL